VDLEAENLSWLTLNLNLERPAAHFTIRREPLRSNAGIDRQLESLPTKRAIDSFRNFHAVDGAVNVVSPVV